MIITVTDQDLRDMGLKTGLPAKIRLESTLEWTSLHTEVLANQL